MEITADPGVRSYGLDSICTLCTRGPLSNIAQKLQ